MISTLVFMKTQGSAFTMFLSITPLSLTLTPPCSSPLKRSTCNPLASVTSSTSSWIFDTFGDLSYCSRSSPLHISTNAVSLRHYVTPFAAQTPKLWRMMLSCDTNTVDNTSDTVMPRPSSSYDIFLNGQGSLLQLISGGVHSLGKFSRSLSVCVSALISFSILPLIIIFSQMPNYLYTHSVAHFRTSVVPPSLGRSLLVDCGLRNWEWYVFRVIVAKKVLLN